MISLPARPGNRITLPDIYFFAPEVADVVRRARYASRGDWRYYRAAKATIARHVGWHATLPYLRSSYAYEIAVDALVAAMGGQRQETKKSRKAKKWTG
jgi:hypothetical protein